MPFGEDDQLPLVFIPLSVRDARVSGAGCFEYGQWVRACCALAPFFASPDPLSKRAPPFGAIPGGRKATTPSPKSGTLPIRTSFCMNPVLAIDALSLSDYDERIMRAVLSEIQSSMISALRKYVPLSSYADIEMIRTFANKQLEALWNTGKS